MQSMKLAFVALFISWMVLGCGSNSSSSGGTAVPDGQLTIHPQMRGFLSACKTRADMFGTELTVYCNDDTNTQNQTRAVLDINAFHGTGTYTVDDTSAGTVQFIDTAGVTFDVTTGPASP